VNAQLAGSGTDVTEFHPHSEPCHRCQATAWELVGEFKPRKGPSEDVVECVFCGLLTRVKAVPRQPVVPPAEEFRFRHGRFVGMTFAEVDGQPNGRRYLELMRDTNQKLRERIESYLASVTT